MEVGQTLPGSIAEPEPTTPVCHGGRRIINKLKGVTQSIVSLNGTTKNDVKVAPSSKDRRSIVCLASDHLKVKRKAASIDLVNKKRRLITPGIKLTKISSVNSPVLRPRSTK